MRTLAGLLVFLFATTSVAVAQDRATLVGKPWKVVKSPEAPPGTTFTFENDGTVKVAVSIDGKSRQISGTFELSGSTLTLKLSQDGVERVDVRKIKQLSASTLVVETKSGKVEELSR